MPAIGGCSSRAYPRTDNRVDLAPPTVLPGQRCVLRCRFEILPRSLSLKTWPLWVLSRQVGSIGRTVLDNLAAANFPGSIYPVNPQHKKIGDQPCYATVGELPEVPDLAVICTPARTVPQIVRECGESGILGLVILSAGFRESGQAGAELEAAVAREAQAFDGLRILGPNCLGIMAPHAALNASFAAGMPQQGHVAFISQSGALCTAVLDWAAQENIGFSHFVSVGNMLDVSIGDLIDYFATGRWTESIILYVESITEAREFMSAARAFAQAADHCL